MIFPILLVASLSKRARHPNDNAAAGIGEHVAATVCRASELYTVRIRAMETNNNHVTATCSK